MTIEDRILNWLRRREQDRKLRRYGGIQSCPWCRQLIQTGEKWGFLVWDRDPFIDVATCGCCGGTSLWRFELGMIYIGPLDPPQPASPAVPWYSIPDANLVSLLEARSPNSENSK